MPATDKGAQARGTYRPTKKEQEVLGFLDGRFSTEERESRKRPFERLWFQTIAFYAGHQWVHWNDRSQRLEEKPSGGRARYTANFTFPMVLRAVAQITADRPKTVSVPNSPDRSDVEAARIATKALEHLYDVTKFDAKVRDVAQWGTITGNGFFKVHWNPEGGPTMFDLLDPQTREAISMDRGDKKGEMKRKAGIEDLPIGEVSVESVSPFKIYTDAATSDPFWTDATWVIEASERPLDYIETRWDKGKYVSAHKRRNSLEERLVSLVGGDKKRASLEGDADKQRETATVIELWAKPSKAWPRGIYAVVADNVVLDMRVNHYAEELGVWNPYVPWSFAELPGRFWGLGLVEQLMGPQREYNITRSQMIENKNLTSHPKVLVPNGAGIPNSALRGKGGEVITYNVGAGPPAYLEAPPMPAYVQQHPTEIIREMQMVGFQNDVTQARAPGSLRSGVAIQLLQEQDRSVMGLGANRMSDAIVRVSEIMLRLAAKNWIEPRVIKTISKDLAYQVESFTGADFKNSFDVRVVPHSGFGSGSAVRRQYLLDLMQYGFLDPQNPEHQRATMEAFEMFDVETATHEIARHTRVAEKENAYMKAGRPVQAMDWHDDQAHLEALEKFMNSEEFDAMDEQKIMLFVQHRQEHQQRLQEQMVGQMQMEMAMRGGAGEKGQASPPNRGPLEAGGE